MRAGLSWRLFFFNDTATTEIYTLSLHDALPILLLESWDQRYAQEACSHVKFSSVGRCLQTIFHSESWAFLIPGRRDIDRKSTRLNSSHANISYAVFCLKKNLSTCRISLKLSLMW